MYYDNFLFVSDNSSTIDKIELQLKTNFATYGAVVKEGSMNRMSHQDLTAEGFDFLGVHYQLKRKDKTTHLTWRPAKIVEWCASYENSNLEGRADVSLLECGQWMGRILFGTLLRGRPLGNDVQSRLVRKTLSAIGRLAYHHSWEYCGEKTGDIIAGLTQAWKTIATLKDSSYNAQDERPAATPQWTLATDASDDFEAYQFFSLGTKQWEAFGDSSSWVGSTSHIFIRELEAAVAGITRSLTLFPSERLNLIIDNSAVAFALQNGFSSNALANNLIDTVAEHLHLFDIILVSEDNPADCPTRRNHNALSEDFLRRVEHMGQAISAHQQGRRWSSRPAKIWCGKRAGKLRHHDHASVPEEEIKRIRPNPARR